MQIKITDLLSVCVDGHYCPTIYCNNENDTIEWETLWAVWAKVLILHISLKQEDAFYASFLVGYMKAA